MTDSPDDPALIALGAAVSDGATVDWGEVEGVFEGAEQQRLVRGMRDVAALVSAHRQVDALIAAEAPQDAPRTWRDLVLFEPLGNGAFGVVYRGWDPRLEREVAVKLLRRDAHAPLAEARHLARIRHANVVTIHGADEDDAHAGIWMEYIDGQTLAAMVRDHGVMSAREVIGIGLDLCRALSALHAAGLLHRDIKAHNVMREVGGRIVLMDFSGAQALAPGQNTEVFSGTPLYMAPELFEGGSATASSDVYSLGVLLFFLLTGTVPVDGPTMASLREAHQLGARKRLRDLRADLSESIVQIVECATEPKPASRYQTAGELEHALTGAAGIAALPASVESGSDAPVRLRRWRAAALAAGVVAVVAVAAGVATRRAPVPVAPPIRFAIGPPYLTGSWPRLSPDGRSIVFGTEVENRNRFWIRPLESRDGRLLMNTAANETPFWSPDSRTLAYFADGKLRVISAEGGDPTIVTDAVEPRGGDWAGDQLIFAASKVISVVTPGGGQLRRLTEIDPAQGDFQHVWPKFLPDGRRFLFLIRSQQAERSGVYVGSLDGAPPIRLMPAYSRVTYSAGYLYWVRDGALIAQPFDPQSARFTGAPVSLVGRIRAHFQGDAAFDVASGVLIYGLESGDVSSRLLLVDRRGRPRQALTEGGAFRQPRFSPDGNRVAAEKASLTGGNSELWIYDLARQSASRLAGGTSLNVHPLWSADGRTVLFSSKRDSAYRLFTKLVDGNGPEQAFPPVATEAVAEHWSTDGKYVSATIPRNGLWIFPLTPGQKPWAVRRDPGPNTWHSEFSPDGRFLAYMSRESGRPEVFVEPFPGTGERWQVSTQGGGEPHWRADGQELFYLATDNRLMVVDTTVPDWQHTRPLPLFTVSVPDIDGFSDYAVAPDGQSFVLNVFLSDAVTPPLDVVINAMSLLKK
ncbi:MAG: protein kinase [Vicinamibacterales bacterium]